MRKGIDGAAGILLFFVLAEVFLGGGGRLTAIGPVTLRMILYILALALSGFLLLRSKASIHTEIWLLLGLFTTLIVFSAGLGFFNHARVDLIWKDISPLLFFYMLIFFSLSIKSKADIIIVMRIIQYSSLILAFGYLITFVMVHVGLVPFESIRDLAKNSDEFHARGHIGLFFKGFIYICIGIIFLGMDNKKNSYLLVVALVTAVLLTFTRGFVLALSATFLVYFLFLNRNYYKAAVFLLIGNLTIFYANDCYLWVSQLIMDVNPHYLEGLDSDFSWAFDKDGNQIRDIQLMGDKNWSDINRKAQVTQVLEAITPISFFIGHGLGIGTSVRPVHMEIAYLEIFHKQGIMGLAFWGFLLVFVYRKFQSALSNQQRIAIPFFLSVLFIFFQSVTNSYLNNPIGMSLVLVTLVILNRLGQTPAHNSLPLNEVVELPAGT